MNLYRWIPPLSLLVACTERAPISEPAPVPGIVTTPVLAPTPSEPTSTPAPAPAPTTRPPPQLRVAFEGHCLELGSTTLGDEVFVSYLESYMGPGVIHRLGPDARPETMLPKLDHEHGVSGLFGFEGRWPNQAYLEIGIGYRGSYESSYARFDGTAWSTKVSDKGWIRRVFPWYEDSILALGCLGACEYARPLVIRGKPKGPHLDKALAALGACKSPRIDALAVLESGPVVGVVSCDQAELGTVAIRWSPDDLAGDVHRLLPVGEKAEIVVADDRAAVVYLTIGADKGPGRLLESRAGSWKELTPPEGEFVTGLAVDPEGALWLLRPAGLWRRSGEAWAQEPVGFTGLARLLGVERGTPWVHTTLNLETKLARRDPDGTWRSFVMPRSALFADQPLRPEYAMVDARGELWMNATYARRRKGPTSPPFRFEAVLTTRPSTGPVLRCGDALNQTFRDPFVAWPRGADERCGQRLVLVQKKWRPDDSYSQLRKLVKRNQEFAATRFVELEIAGATFVGAYVDTAEAAAALVLAARKLRSSSYPEVICGDAEELTAAGATVGRELVLATPPAKAP